MTTDLNRAFTGAQQASGEALRFTGGSNAFTWQVGRHTPLQALYDAVNDVRQWLADRGLPAGTRAARDGQESLATFLAGGGTFTQLCDSRGLDAGYYVARSCLNYDFVTLGEVARIGAVGYVEPVRYYNQTPDGPSLFRAALGAGLRFTQACDAEGRTAGFFVARCGDPELIALYRQAGGTFSALDREALSASSCRSA